MYETRGYPIDLESQRLSRAQPGALRAEVRRLRGLR